MDNGVLVLSLPYSFGSAFWVPNQNGIVYTLKLVSVKASAFIVLKCPLQKMSVPKVSNI